MGRRACIVSFCNSNSKKPPIVDGMSKKLSFHEIPANEEIRSQWLKAISRCSSENKYKKWIPTDDRCVVCSLHFTADDFKEGVRNNLKPNSVPSIFPNYPSYLTKVPKKRKEPTPRLSLPVPPKLTKTNVDLVEDSSRCLMPSITNNVEQLDHTYPRNTNEKIGTSNDIEELKKKIKTLQQKVRRLEKKKSSDALLNVHLSKLKEIIEESHNGSLTAKMLLDQIHAFNCKSNHRWSEEIIRKCMLWRSKSPSSYALARKIELFNLPSKSTLQRYSGLAEQGLTPIDL